MKMERQIVTIKDEESGWLDLIGAAISWTCAAHCIALPLLISLMPFVGLTFLLDESVERTITGASVLIAVASLLPGYFRRHGKIRTIVLFIAGISLIVISHSAFEEELTAKISFLLVSASLITAAHFINRRLCRECAACRVDVD